MDTFDKVLEKLLNKTAKTRGMNPKPILWISYASFPEDKSLPYNDSPNTIKEESYLMNAGDHKSFYLITTESKNFKQKLKLIFADIFNKSDSITISEDQAKLFELKTLIEYAEPEKTLLDSLDDFIND